MSVSFSNNNNKDKSKDGSSAPDAPPIQLSISRNLSDRLYEKRKMGALDVEQLIKELVQAKEEEKIRNVVQYIVTNFSESPQGNYRKGGLIALAASAIGLGPETYKYIMQLVPPVLKCFTDQDPRVRYYACESLYNIAKVARGKILSYFNEIFDALCKLSADPDVNVKNGAQLLDRLVKDILTETGTLDIEHFIPLLEERVYVINPYCRQFLIAWVVVLDSVPGIDLVVSTQVSGWSLQHAEGQHQGDPIGGRILPRRVLEGDQTGQECRLCGNGQDPHSALHIER